MFAAFRCALVLLVLFASQSLLGYSSFLGMTSFRTLPPDAGLDICLLWQSTMNRLISRGKQLPSVSQLFEIFLRGPISALDVLSGVVMDDVRYPPGWLPWRSVSDYVCGLGSFSGGFSSVVAKRTSVS